MKSTLLRQVSIMTVLAAFSSLAWACPDVPHVVSGIEMHQAMTARILGFDPASTADPYLPPELMNQGVIARTVDKDLGFDLASTADPYLPPELMNQSVVAGTSVLDLSGSSDLNQLMDPTAAGNTTPYCDWETHMKGFMD